MEWKSIESDPPPMDGTPYMIYSEGRIGIAYQDPREWEGLNFMASCGVVVGPDPYNDMKPGCAMSDHYCEMATHWLPLPDAPKEIV